MVCSAQEIATQNGASLPIRKKGSQRQDGGITHTVRTHERGGGRWDSNVASRDCSCGEAEPVRLSVRILGSGGAMLPNGGVMTYPLNSFIASFQADVMVHCNNTWERRELRVWSVIPPPNIPYWT